MKKILARLLIISIFVSGVYFLKPPQKAEAVVSPDVPSNIFNSIINFLTTGEEIYETAIVTVLEVAVQKLADKVLDKLVQDTLSWANGGFDGDPGFINNYEDFLKGTAHETISSTFVDATKAAEDALVTGISITQCIEELNEPQQCNDDYLNDFEGCIFGLDPIEDEEEYNACEDMRDEMQFAHDLCLDQWIVYNQKIAECENISGNPGTQAQQNYNKWASGEVTSTRAVAETVARFGAKKLNYDPLNALINGEGETLSKLLGSQEQKDAFSSDFNAGGIMGYIALADPHNSSLGKQGLVESALANKTEQKVETKKEDVSLVQRYLSKDSCSNGSKPVNGTCPEGEQLQTQTPGDIVGEQVSNSLKSEQNKATFADGLVDSLVKAIGDLTDGLLEAGVSGLTDAATNTFFNQNESNNEFGNTYQSEYDVLGITNDIGNDGGPGGPNGPGGPGGPNNSDLFIGGPEHTEGTYGTQPQIIISFEADLEKNLNFLLEEKKYYEEVRRALARSSNVLYEFDKCIPGADYGWEQRYQDSLSFYGDNDDEGSNEGVENKIGFNEQKNMLQDPKVTIPGGTTLKSQHQSILKSAQDNSQKNKFRLDQINSSIASLEYIKQSVLEDFNQQKEAYNSNLVLLKSEWDKLSDPEKAEALQIATEQGFFINSGGSGTGLLTPAEALAIIQSDEAKASAAVLATSWNIWRKQTDAEQKLELRKAYYVTIPKLSSEDFVANAKILSSQLEQVIENGFGLALDCMVFKMYALGISRDYIAGIVFSSDKLEDKVLTAAAVINNYDPMDTGTTVNSAGQVIEIVGGVATGFPIAGKIGGWLGGGKNELVSQYFDVSRARSNEAILAFIESEYNLKEQNLPSVFTTTNMISPEAINYSILGFETKEARNEYFDLYYPDLSGQRSSELGRRGLIGRMNAHVASNVFTIKEMYKNDRVYADSNRLQGGMRGFLFCRTPGEFIIVNNDGDKNDDWGSRCWTAYYSASRMDYQLLIAGINN